MLIETPKIAAKTIEFLGINFSSIGPRALIEELRDASRRHRFSYMVTPNVDHVVKLSRLRPTMADRQFGRAYDLACIRPCDSRILARLARMCGIALPVAPGSDLTAILFNYGFAKTERVAIIGGLPDYVERLEKLFPGPDYVQHIPPMGVLGNEAAMAQAADFIRSARANWVFLAMGAPQSEILASRLVGDDGVCGVGLCVGASIDYLVGEQVRAPVWIQRWSMEWAHRLLSQPGRMWRRYLVEGPQIALIVWNWHRSRRARARTAPRPYAGLNPSPIQPMLGAASFGMLAAKKCNENEEAVAVRLSAQTTSSA